MQYCVKPTCGECLHVHKTIVMYLAEIYCYRFCFVLAFTSNNGNKLGPISRPLEQYLQNIELNQVECYGMLPVQVEYIKLWHIQKEHGSLQYMY